MRWEFWVLAGAWRVVRPADMVIADCKVQGVVQGACTLYSYDRLRISVEAWTDK